MVLRNNVLFRTDKGVNARQTEIKVKLLARRKSCILIRVSAGNAPRDQTDCQSITSFRLLPTRHTPDAGNGVVPTPLLRA